MNGNMRIFVAGVGSLANILPFSRHASDRVPESYLNGLCQPSQPLSADEAAAFNAAAIRSDWIQTGAALRNAATSLGLHVLP
jgi:hypothetical protein